jgi:hypothetical protein
MFGNNLDVSDLIDCDTSTIVHYQSGPLTSEEERQGRRVRQLRDVQDEALNLFSQKNRDYGDAFADYGPVGVLVRLGDKLRRAGNISSTGVMLVKNEGLRDTLLDLHNYAAMAIMLLDEEIAESATRQHE